MMNKDSLDVAERSVLSLDAERYQAMVQADTATLDRLLDDRLLYTHSNGETDTKDTYLAAVGSGDFFYESIDHETHHVINDGDTVVLVGVMRASVTIRGTYKTLNNAALGVWLKSQAGWRLAAYQTTPLPH